MTTIRHLPEELLRLVFADLDLSDLKHCKYVRRSWYLAAHLPSLHTVELCSPYDIEAFIKSIDANPDPVHLNSVYSVTIEDYPDSWVTREALMKLILRFPKLQDLVLANNSIATQVMSDEETRQLIPECCPYLKSIKMHDIEEHKVHYYDLLYKLRHTINTVDIVPHIELPDGHSNVQDYLTKFPLLETINNRNGDLSSFEAYIPIIEKLSHLKAIVVGPTHDRVNFMEQYLTKKTPLEKIQLIKKLSQLTDLTIYYDRGFCANAAKFIHQYLTGLKSLSFSSSNAFVSREDISMFFHFIMNRVPSMEFAKIVLNGLDIATFQFIFSPVIENVYSPSASIRNVLRLEVLPFSADDEDWRWVRPLDIKFELSEDTRKIDVSYSLQVRHETLVDILHLASPDEFVVNFSQINDSLDVVPYCAYRKLIKRILNNVPTLKMLVLETTNIFQDSYQRCKIKYITSLVLKCIPTSLKELRNCLEALPNLTHLQTHFFCGVWDDFLYEYQLALSNCNLEKLTVDLTTISTKYSKRFFVIAIELFPTCGRRLYKLTNNLSDVRVIKDEDLEGFNKLEDFVLVHIMVSNLRSLDVFVCSNENQSSNKLQVTVFDNSEHKH